MEVEKNTTKINFIEPAKLKLKEKLAYATGDLASNIIFQAISLLILFYWTEKAGISAATAGIILLISRIFDGFIDVVMGTIVDRTKSKHGKARPYLLWLALPMALAVTVTFWTPASTSNALNIAYAFITYNITMLIYTGINIPYGVLSSKMTNDQNERGVLSILRGLGALVAILIVSAVAPVLAEKIGYTLTFLILGLIASGLFLVTFYGTKERVGATAESEDIPLKIAVAALFKNVPWLIMLFGGCVFFAAMTVRTTATAYFAQYYMGETKYVALLTILALPGYTIGMAIAAPLYKKFGKVKTTIYSNIVAAVVAIPMYFLIDGKETLPMIIAYLVISGITMGTASSGFFAMVTDTIEYGEWKTGVRIEGLTYSAASVGTKVGGGIGAAIVGVLLGAAGYDPSLSTQPEGLVSMIEWVYLWVPVIGGLIVSALMMFNDVDKKYPQILKDLAVRKGE